MKLISIGNGHFAKVDDADFKWLSQYPWRLFTSGRGDIYCGFSKRINGKSVNFHMHRVVMNVLPGLQVDHINGDKLDNRKSNLRICTNQQNNFNKGKRKDNTSGFTGVRWHTKDKNWSARINLNGKEKYLGGFKTKEEAIAARVAAVEKYHGEFANLN